MDGSGLDEHWLKRFQAISRAQGRYLFTLLLVMVLFWSLHVQVQDAEFFELHYMRITVPIFGIVMNSAVVWACAPAVLGLLILAVLGTFDALEAARTSLGEAARGRMGFERHDVSPNALDFIVYQAPNATRLHGLAYLSYPGFVSVAYYQAVHVGLQVAITDLLIPGRRLLLLIGAILLLWALPRLGRLWRRKTKSMVDVFRKGPA